MCVCPALVIEKKLEKSYLVVRGSRQVGWRCRCIDEGEDADVYPALFGVLVVSFRKQKQDFHFWSFRRWASQNIEAGPRNRVRTVGPMEYRNVVVKHIDSSTHIPILPFGFVNIYLLSNMIKLASYNNNISYKINKLLNWTIIVVTLNSLVIKKNIYK